MQYFVSVIIPVFNDSQRLKICLDALENQTYPKNLYEIVVIDNGSDEGQNTKEVVSQFNQAFLTYESRPSSYAARNKGISLAKGDIIAFTDADCIPAANWIEKGVANLLSVPKCGLVAGKVEFFFRNPHKPTAVELYDSLTVITQKQFVEDHKYGATANVFTFRNIIDAVGCFDDKLKSSGDREWGMRVFSSGYQLVYADDTCVAHPARYSYAQLYQKFVRLSGGWHDLKQKQGYSFTALIKDLATQDLKLPIKTIYRIILGQEIVPWSDKKVSGFLQKIELSFVFLFVRFAIARERIRLYFGGISQRA